MRRRSWSACHDHPRGYQHGEFKRSYPGDGRSRRTHRALNGCTERGPRMDKQKVRDRIAEIGVVPVVRASSPEQALLAARSEERRVGKEGSWRRGRGWEKRQ